MVLKFRFVTLDDLGWNTIEDMVQKWNEVFHSYINEPIEQEYSLIQSQDANQ